MLTTGGAAVVQASLLGWRRRRQRGCSLSARRFQPNLNFSTSFVRSLVSEVVAA